MCGIAGFFSFNKKNLIKDTTLLDSMLNTMAHRGPDGGGTWISADGMVGFGHRRLSIIDLSNLASQPMGSEDNSIQVTFNGEIYNHTEIRKELQECGNFKWKTDHSDTEVIVHAYEQWGIDCVKKFRGMFAIGIWDSKRREMWLIRDRLGVKPLYYSFYEGKLTFASEIKAILADPDRSRILNEDSFFHYLSFLATPAPNTLFEGINKIPCGTWLNINQEGKIKEFKYWDALDNALENVENLNNEQLVERILSELKTSVALRKVSDVPVGIFLSGGIDSSLNAALFSVNEKIYKVKTFSIGYEGEYKTYKNELDFARMMADYISVENYQKKIND
jgi:asparagine synthase (glutamine-hydrolysing)